ncbi:hypothetical protein AX14_009966 [Amanita brunnescens Koide BX004]|nr:hypothetical protein AX14_009966 [Amanita brunnescens Koide BX004]
MASFEMQRRGGDSGSEFGPDDNVFPLFNSSPLRLEMPPVLEYPALGGITSLGDYTFSPSGFAEPAASPRPRSMADDVDYNLNYFNSYVDRSATLNNAGSGSGSGYTYGLTSAASFLPTLGPSLPQQSNGSFMPTSQFCDISSQSASLVYNARLEPLDMVPAIPSIPDTRHTFFAPDGSIYDMTSSVHDAYHLQQGLGQADEALAPGSDGIQPSFSFSLPGMPNAEEAFLSQFHDPAANIGGASISEVLGGEEQQRVLQYPSGSDYQSTLSGTNIFGIDHRDLVPRSMSPGTSESSRASQKRPRDQAEPSTSTSVKRQRVNRSDDNYVQGSTRKKKHGAFFDSNSLNLGFGSDDEDENDFGDDDSDAYIPSRSPSPVPPSLAFASTSPSASPPPSDGLASTNVKGKQGRRKKGKGKAIGSAAHALAIVTRARERQDSSETMEFGFPELHGGDGLQIGDVSAEGPSRTRRAPVPVPVPNLIKKSRGRKVPYVPALRGGEGIGEGVPVASVATLTPSRRRGRRITTATGGRGGSAVQDPDGDQLHAPDTEERTFVCMVPGCGKCFVRGEHLKRHIRSIHTDDKQGAGSRSAEEII